MKYQIRVEEIKYYEIEIEADHVDEIKDIVCRNSEDLLTAVTEKEYYIGKVTPMFDVDDSDDGYDDYLVENGLAYGGCGYGRY